LAKTTKCVVNGWTSIKE